MKNRLSQNWQRKRDTEIKCRQNFKIKPICPMLTTHRQDEYDKFIAIQDTRDHSVNKLNKSLLNQISIMRSLNGLNGLIF